MKSVHVLFFSYCFISSCSARLAAPALTYQDSFGQYSFGYSSPYSARSEIRTLNGETRGAYSYIDDAGVIQTVEYVADATHGFRILSTNSMQNTEGALLAQTGQPQTKRMERKEDRLGKNNALQGSMEFKEKRKGNKNQLKSSIINESKMFEISQGNLRINPFHFYTPINEARDRAILKYYEEKEKNEKEQDDS